MTSPHPLAADAPDAEEVYAFPVSFAQRRQWILNQLEPGEPAYNLSSVLRLAGPLDAAVLERCFGEVTARHEALRTVFMEAEGELLQVVHPPRPFSLPVVDLPGLGGEDLHRVLAEEARVPFDLARGPLLRARLLQLGEEDHVLQACMHHIVSDGWSIGLLFREVSRLYEAFSAGRPSPLAELPIQYADFAIWQRDWLQGDVLRTQLDFWTGELRGAPALELPADRPRAAERSAQGAVERMAASPGLAAAVRAFSREHRVTLFTTLLAAWEVVLARHAGQGDFCVGTPVAGRTREETEALIGFFINTVALRARVSGAESFGALVRGVRDTVFRAFAHQDLPFERVVEELRPERDLSRTPVFQVMFVLQQAEQAVNRLGGSEVSQLEVDLGAAKFDLTLAVLDVEGADVDLELFLEYATALFDRETVRRLLERYVRLLGAAVADPGRPVGELPLLGERERRQVVEDWNATETAYEPLCVHELFERQAVCTPAREAVRFRGAGLTYRELGRRADALAARLRARGVGPEVRVGVALERSAGLVVALLAVLKAGGAYVPLDPGYPAERLGYMLRDSGVALVLTDADSPLGAGSTVPVLVCGDGAVSADAGGDDGEEGDRVPPRIAGGVTPDNLCYVIYTSGSTGRPKGAMNTHRAVSNRLQWMQRAFELGGDDRVLQKTPFGFDVSVWEFFWPLATGATLVVAEPGGHHDPAWLARAIEDEAVTTLHFVPSMLQLFLDEPELERRARTLRRVVASGEALPPELARRCRERLPATLHNLYGPTEAAVDVSAWQCGPADEHAVPIGRPIDNVRLYVLDERGGPVPPGVAGELHIGGVQVGRGYLGKPGMTAERFVPDAVSGRGGGRLYRTGDRARWRADGALEYLGRTDQQVKVRGVRIEPGEVEHALRGCPGVADAAVAVCPDSAGEPRLVAWVVPASAGPLDAVGVRARLERVLPAALIPSAFVALERLPLSPNGKLDRAALPTPAAGGERAGERFEEPGGEVERAVAAIWREVLGVERVGVRSNFFDLGGHSMLVIRVQRLLRARFGVEVPVTELFRRPTVRALADYFTAGGGESAPAAVSRARSRASLRKSTLR